MGKPLPIGPPELLVVYQGTSSERPLEELKMHKVLDGYRSAKNLIAKPMMPKDSVSIDTFVAGPWYLTVVRKILSLPVSDRVALTTAEPLWLDSGLYEVWVFDESFRIFDPKPTKR